jgi:hypothetical protein
MLAGAFAFALWACNDRRLVKPIPAPSVAVNQRFLQAVNRKLDLLFMIDNSLSMQPLQDKLAKNLPVLVQGLTALPGGLPDIHIAVVSSSVSPGMLMGVQGCRPGDVDNGAFRHTFNPANIANHPECNGLTLNGNFIKAEAGQQPNFTGPIETVFGCIALLGQAGCGFEYQLGSIEIALDPQNPIPGNAGFLRSDAFLGIVLLTNEDDCSAPSNTHLFDDVTSTSAGQWGRLMSYRCTEFGILCNGQKPPHTLPPMQTEALTGCVSAEDKGELVPISEFEDFLLALKHGDRSKILIASISGAPTPFAVSTYQSRSSTTPDPKDPMAPGLVPSCVATNGTDYSDPGVRIAQVVNDLGGVLFSICADDYSPAMAQIAQALGHLLGPECLPSNIVNNASGAPDCAVVNHVYAADGTSTGVVVPYCNVTAPPYPSPCWQLLDSPANCGTQKMFKVCRDPTCAMTPPTTQNSSDDTTVSCAVTP